MEALLDMFDPGAQGVTEVVLDAALKGALVLAAIGIAVLLARKASAAVRHLVWCVGLVSLIALPLLSVILPAWRIPVLPARPVEPASVSMEAPAIESAPVEPFIDAAPARSTVLTAGEVDVAPALPYAEPPTYDPAVEPPPMAVAARSETNATEPVEWSRLIPPAWGSGPPASSRGRCSGRGA